jgi:colicin import membrane protein
VKHNPPDPHPLDKPRQPGGIRAVALAIFVHAAFFALIVFGVAWQSKPTPPVEAEIWDKLPPVAKAAEKKADQPPKPPEPPKAEPEPPKPEVKPPPPKPEVKPPPPKTDPAIALKLEREKREKETAEKQKRERLEKQKEDEAKKKREQEDKRRADEKKRAEDERARREAEKAREAAALAKQNEITRFVDAIKARIRGKANVPDTVTGNPEVQVRIRILPGGEVLDIAITRRSGNPSYDSAIERAIRSASPLPVPAADSELFPQFRDLNLQIRHER